MVFQKYTTRIYFPVVCFLGIILTVISQEAEIMSQKSSAVEIPNLQDIRTPVGVSLSGIYKRSFAFLTIKDRLPVILTRIIDTLSRNKETIAETHGEAATNEIKEVIHAISELKNEMVTNKPLKMLHPLSNDEGKDDTDIWNKYLENRTEIEGRTPTWFNTLWLYCECYMYRRLIQIFLLTETLNKYDPFAEQKQTAFIHSTDSINTLANYTMHIVSEKDMTETKKKEELIKLLKINLWGNRCDLSLSAGSESNQNNDPIEILNSFNDDILANDSNCVWEILNKNKTNDDNIVDIIFDNAGYEFFTDICFATFLIAQGLAQKVRFYVKRYPWYVSDTTANDFHWTVNYMKNSSDPQLRALGELSLEHLKNNVWSIEEEPFWTLPYNITEMKQRDVTLYTKLSEAKLVIFKGDLNYRKLVSDINWEYTTSFRKALMDFQPTNVLSLRTIKSDVCVGLQPGKAEILFEINENWMFTGQYGLIQSNIDVDNLCSHNS